MTIKDKVAIVGASCTPFGEHWDLGTDDLLTQAATEALDTANVGKDAIEMSRGRSKISDETWVAMGDDLPDQDYNGRFFEYFGIRLL